MSVSSEAGLLYEYVKILLIVLESDWYSSRTKGGRTTSQSSYVHGQIRPFLTISFDWSNFYQSIFARNFFLVKFEVIRRVVGNRKHILAE